MVKIYNQDQQQAVNITHHIALGISNLGSYSATLQALHACLCLYVLRDDLIPVVCSDQGML